MTELTVLDIVTILLFALMIVGLWGMALERLNRKDSQAGRISQCPPHEWMQTYADLPDGGYQFAGLRCTKCRQRPGGLANGESWFPHF